MQFHIIYRIFQRINKNLTINNLIENKNQEIPYLLYLYFKFVSELGI